ncbi:MAG: hypothetical protein EOP06_07045 [Proteobacteria bacterium]|nr:MAG: hypothetical protein EOP06_07045 [Pseudomonadota bacterium]
MRYLSTFDFKFWVSILLNVLFVCYAGYFNLYEVKPEIKIDLVQRLEVLEVKEAVPGLKVQLNEVDLFEQKKSLSIVTVRIANIGVDISPERFDANHPFGIKFNEGEILDAKLLPTSSLYIRGRIIPVTRKDSVIIPSFFFPQKESFELKILVLHDEDISPTISSIGTIAGIQNFPVLTSYQEPARKSFWSRAADGNLGIHITRLIVYVTILFLVALISLVTIVAPIAWLSEAFAKRKRLRAIERFERLHGGVPSEFKFLADYFLSGSSSSLILTKSLLDYREILDFPVAGESRLTLPAAQNAADVLQHVSRPNIRAVRDAILANIDIKNGDEFKRFKAFVERLVDFLIQNESITLENERELRRLVIREYKIASREKRRLHNLVQARFSITELQIEAVRKLLPPQPWPKGTHIRVCEQLSLNKRQYNTAIDELMKKGVFKQQIDGSLYEYGSAEAAEAFARRNLKSQEGLVEK